MCTNRILIHITGFNFIIFSCSYFNTFLIGYDSYCHSQGFLAILTEPGSDYFPISAHAPSASFLEFPCTFFSPLRITFGGISIFLLDFPICKFV